MGRGTINSWALKDYQEPLPENAEVKDGLLKYKGRLFINLKETCGWGVNQYIQAFINSKSKSNYNLNRGVMEAMDKRPVCLKGPICLKGRIKHLATFYDLEFLLTMASKFRNAVDEGAKTIAKSNYLKVVKCLETLQRMNDANH